MNNPRNLAPGAQATNQILGEARQRFVAGHPEEAERMLLDLLERVPNDLKVITALGILASETGRFDVAKQRMSKALAIDPKCVMAMCWMSILLLNDGDLEGARNYADKALALDPRNPATHAGLARCLVKQGMPAEAVRRFQQSLEINPQNPPLMFEFADALIGMGSEREAISVLERAVQMTPDNKALLKLAYLEIGLGRVSQAKKYCQRVLTSAPQMTSAHIIMGRILTEELNLAEADKHWNIAKQLDPESGSLHLEHALSLTAIGHFEEAIVELRHSIETRPEQGSSYQALTYAKRVTEGDRPMVAQMERILATSNLDNNDRLSLLYSLGKSYDNLGDYEVAIHYFDRANELKKRILGSQPFDRSAFTAYIDARIKLFSKPLFEECRTIGISSSIPLLIVGMMRSGTTLAEQMLSCHPLVGGAGEQHFWGDHESKMVDFGQSRVVPARIRQYAQEYADLLASIAPGFPYVIDKNPANLQVLGSVHVAFPNSRIVHTRRNAIDTAISIWTTPMRTNAPFINDRDSIVYAYKEYLRLMEHWRKVLPANRFFEVHYEDLVTSPATVVPQMVEFCGLDWDEACLHPESNERRVKTPSLWQVRQPVYKTSTERWKNYEPWLGAFEELRGLS